MSDRDERLGTALRALDVPEHGPDFASGLACRLNQETAGGRRVGLRPSRLRPPMLLGVLAAAAALIAVVTVSTMLADNRPPVAVEAGGGRISDTTILSIPTSQPVVDPPTTSVGAPATMFSGSSSTTSTTRPPGPALTAASALDVGGLGPVRVGMTPAEATAAAGIPIVAPSGAPGCAYATVTGGPAGVGFMLADGRIARVDVGGPGSSPVKTLSGAGIGDTEAQVQARYSNGLQVSPAKYIVGGHDLTLVPTDAADKDYRLIFETDGSKVTAFRSGKLPEVGFVERCG